jgi:hypothetical protein
MTGHFTQVVWKASQRLGCAHQLCKTVRGLDGWIDAHYLVCRYDPPGNYAGQYVANVLPP